MDLMPAKWDATAEKKKELHIAAHGNTINLISTKGSQPFSNGNSMPASTSSKISTVTKFRMRVDNSKVQQDPPVNMVNQLKN